MRMKRLPLIFQTVTSRLLVADTPAEAVENIILHTDKVSSAYFFYSDQMRLFMVGKINTVTASLGWV